MKKSLIFIVILGVVACGKKPDIVFTKPQVISMGDTIPYDDDKDTTANFVQYVSDRGEHFSCMFYTGEVIPDTILVGPEFRDE